MSYEQASPVFIKITGVPVDKLPKIHEFLERSENLTKGPIGRGTFRSDGFRKFVELGGSEFDAKHGTYTVNLIVQPYFNSYENSDEKPTNVYRCSGVLLLELFGLLGYFPMPVGGF